MVVIVAIFSAFVNKDAFDDSEERGTKENYVIVFSLIKHHMNQTKIAQFKCFYKRQYEEKDHF